ncbi:MAG: copper resistance protein CopC [Chloroflexi bacterium]|nr:copper resistance protein CopC [Chloroflexota bacterium]
MRITLSMILLAIALLVPQLASAHAEPVSSTPEAGATIDTAPTSVSVVFGQKLGTDGNSLTVTDATGTRVDTGNTTLDPNDTRRQTLLVSLKTGLGAGTYAVAWKTLSADDGETAEGRFTFMVRGSATGSAPGASPTATSSPSASGSAPAGGSDAATTPAVTLPDTGSGSGSELLTLVAALLLTIGGFVLRRRAQI